MVRMLPQDRLRPGASRPTWILPVFLPHLGCPHRCVFCDQSVMAPNSPRPSPSELRERLDDSLRCAPGGGHKRRQIAFYGGSFTGMSASLQEDYLEAAREFLVRGEVDSLRVSTRPDGISRERLTFLADRGVETVEIGVQSLSDRVLQASRRGYAAGQVLEAIAAVQAAGLEVGAQIMAGLPGDTGADSMATAEALCEVRPDFARIYPLLVFRDTELARWVEQGRYRPWTVEAAVSLCSRMLERFEESSIPVVRIGVHDAGRLLGPAGAVRCGPAHPAFGFLVRADLFRRRALAALGSRPRARRPLRVSVHPHDRPLLSGYRGQNLVEITERVGAGGVTVREDPNCVRGRVVWG